MGVPAHQATTRHLGAAYPFASEAGLGGQGVLIGRDLLGGAFVYDPFELYRRGLLTNPNMVVFGQIGRGKSAFVKTYLWRQAVFGRRAWVVDPKGEYGSLARAGGIEPLALRPGSHLRLNPLEAPSSGPRSSLDDVSRRRAELLSSLAAASLGRSLEPAERTAIELAVAAVSGSGCDRGRAPVERRRCPHPAPGGRHPPDPSEASAAAVRTTAELLAADGRCVALELRRLVAGDLQGMFDGTTTPGISLDGSARRSRSVRRLPLTGPRGPHDLCHGVAPGRRGRAATPAVPTRRGRRGRRGVGHPGQPGRGPAGSSRWKLSRAWGVANIAVLHRLSDLTSAGASGSEQVGLAQGLLADSETR